MAGPCGDVECKYNSPNGCTRPIVSHTADRICIDGRRKRNDTAEMMQASAPSGHKRGGKWVSN